MSTWRDTQAQASQLTTASTLGCQGFLCKRESKLFSPGVFCSEGRHCYPDFVVETWPCGIRDALVNQTQAQCSKDMEDGI